MLTEQPIFVDTLYTSR